MYIGLTSLENLVDEVIQIEGGLSFTRLYATPVYTQQPIGGYGITRLTGHIVVAFASAGDVYYCRIPLGHVEYLGEIAEDEVAAGKRDRMARAWLTVKSWLETRGAIVVPALVGLPNNIQLLDGTAGCLVDAPLAQNP